MNSEDLISQAAHDGAVADYLDDQLLRACRANFLVFARSLIIPSARGPLTFSTCMADFQRSAFESLAPSLHAIRDGTMPPIRRFWIERTKKASKDNDLAIALCWLMAFAERPILVQVVASHREQAGIIEARSRDLLYYNKWLSDHVEIVQRCIRNRKNPRTILTKIEPTSTAAQAQGTTPDLVVLNELVHVERWEVMEAHMNNVRGVPRGVAVVSTNAGMKGTKAALWRDNAIKDSGPDGRWRVHLWSTPAPWINPEDVKEAIDNDPAGHESQRLWFGRWQSGTGDAIKDELIDAAFCLPGPTLEPEKGWVYLAALDLGVNHDHTGLVVLAVNAKEIRAKVVYLKAWIPSVPNDKGKLEVDSEAVERECERLSSLYNIQWFGYDPAAGGSFMAQRLRRRGIPMAEVTFSATNKNAMATAFVKIISDRRLECYDDEEGRLRRDIGKFHIVPKIPGHYKLEAVSDEYGHADVGMALVIILPRVAALLSLGVGYYGDHVLAGVDASPLTENELEEMDEGLRDIHDAVDESIKEQEEDWADGFGRKPIRRNRRDGVQ